MRPTSGRLHATEGELLVVRSAATAGIAVPGSWLPEGWSQAGMY
jgi:hypothetical protein